MKTYIHHATIFDGLGGEGYQGHVLVEDGMSWP
jgi:hypothetical protein